MASDESDGWRLVPRSEVGDQMSARRKKTRNAERGTMKASPEGGKLRAEGGRAEGAKATPSPARLRAGSTDKTDEMGGKWAELKSHAVTGAATKRLRASGERKK